MRRRRGLLARVHHFARQVDRWFSKAIFLSCFGLLPFVSNRPH